MVAQPAAAHSQTTTKQRCSYDPFAGRQCWTETVTVAHTHSCGAGMTGTYPNCYPIPPANQNCGAGTTGTFPDCYPIPSDNKKTGDSGGDDDGGGTDTDSDDTDDTDSDDDGGGTSTNNGGDDDDDDTDDEGDEGGGTSTNNIKPCSRLALPRRANRDRCPRCPELPRERRARQSGRPPESDRRSDQYRHLSGAEQSPSHVGSDQRSQRRERCGASRDKGGGWRGDRPSNRRSLGQDPPPEGQAAIEVTAAMLGCGILVYAAGKTTVATGGAAAAGWVQWLRTPAAKSYLDRTCNFAVTVTATAIVVRLISPDSSWGCGSVRCGSAEKPL